MRKSELGLMVSSLKQAAKMRETVDLSARVLALIKDVNCLMMFGNKYAEEEFGSVITETLEVGKRLNLADYFPCIGVFDLQGLNRKMQNLSEIADGFLEKIINDHVQNKDKKETKDFVDTMMATMESGEAEFEFDRRHIKAVLLDLLVAGTETSAGTVISALSELINHPQAMKKLQNELELAVGMDVEMVEESHLDKLQYLDYVLKETLRLHPVLPLLLPHESVEDCAINGFHIPQGTRTIVNVWAIGRDPSVWADPETFSPERFIGSDIDLRGQHFQLIPFGSGRRGCPGLQLAITVVRLVLAQLVHGFDWELPNSMMSYDPDMSENSDKPLMVSPSCKIFSG